MEKTIVDAGEILDRLIKDRLSENEALKRNAIEFYKTLGIYNFVTVLLLERLKVVKNESEEAFNAILDTLSIHDIERDRIKKAVELFPDSTQAKDVYATINVLDRILSPFSPIPYSELSEKFAEGDIFKERELENIIGRLILAIGKRK